MHMIIVLQLYFNCDEFPHILTHFVKNDIKNLAR